MKTYVKTIEAEQFLGDIDSLTIFIGPESTLTVEEGKVVLVTPTKKWNVAKGDYVARGYYELLVFKPERFLKEFTESTFIKEVRQENKIDKEPAQQTIGKFSKQQGNNDIASTEPKINKFDKD